MSHTINHYIQQFEYAKKAAADFIPLDNSLLTLRPTPDRWSAAECFDHLNKAGRLYYKQIMLGMENAKKVKSAGADPMRLRLPARWFVHYLEPPVSFKSPAPASFQPSVHSDLHGNTILRKFQEMQDSFIEQLQRVRSQQIDLASVKVSNPVISWIRMTAAEGFAITEAHQRRHIEQALQAVNREHLS